MKIVCDSCSAKYSIADEKVAGRVFKIRCKKCGSAIVVRGDQVDAQADDSAAPAAAAAPRVVEYGGDAVWHIVVDGDQQGPYSPTQIGELLSAGTIGWDAYVWREGFEDWKPAQDVDELVSAVMGAGDATSSARASSSGSNKQPRRGGGPDMGADPFSGGASELSGSQLESESSGDVFGGRASRGGGVDLFAQTEAASPFGRAGDEDDDVVASAPGPRVSAEQALTGARNENSVLFSLSNLQALATGGGPGSVPPPGRAAPSVAPRAGMAAGEGSGLIDIRALASATGVTGGGFSSGPVTSASTDRVDDLLSIGAGAGGLGSSLGAPVLVPERKEEKSNTGLIIAIAGTGVAVVAAAAVVLVVLLRDDGQTVNPTVAAVGAVGPGQGVIGSPTTPSTVGTAPVDPTPSNTMGDPTPTARTGGAAPTRREEPSARANTPESSGHRGAHTRADGDAPRAPASAQAAEPAPAGGGRARPAAGGGGGSDRDIDALLNDALGGGGGGAPERPARAAGGGGGGGDAPAGGGGGGGGTPTPSRGDVVGAMNSVADAVGGCGGGEHGLAPVRIVFSGSTGRVTAAEVSGGSFAPQVRSCIARAVRGARVPPFSQPSFSVNYPFRL